MERMLARRAVPADTAAGPPRADAGSAFRAVVVGYGPVGRTVARLLRQNGLDVTIVEMNVDTVRALRDDGVDAIFGDATHPAVLAEARLAEARAFVVAVAPLEAIGEAFRLAREQNRDLRILARATSVRDGQRLREQGADVVFSGEAEVALAFTTEILDRLGATPDQIDRERARVRAELA
jgi:CPA2 family monovalent cation:H+ antiporter-2